MGRITVADIMTKKPVTIDPDKNLLECAKVMVRKHVGAIVLVKDKKMVGFLSQKDILWALIKKSKKDLKDIKAKDISVRKVATVKSTAEIKEVIKKMKLKKFDRLPVVDKGKELVGIVTIKDILNFNPEYYPELEEFAEIREEQEKLNRIKRKEVAVTEDGICEECGGRDILYRFNGMLICGSCKNSM